MTIDPLPFPLPEDWPTPPGFGGSPTAGATPRSTGRGRATATTGTVRRRGGTTQDSWQQWWRLSRELYDAGVEQLTDPVSDRDGFLTGRTRRQEPSASPIASRFRRDVLPELLNLMRSEDDQVAGAAVLAIARTAPAGAAAPLYSPVLGALQHRSERVRATAILALGLLGDPRAVEPLLSIARDDRAGRRLLGEGGGVSCSSRALAALGLGFLGVPDVGGPLLELVPAASCVDLRASLVLGAAHAAPADTSVGMGLVQLLRSPRQDRKVRSQAAIALSRMDGYVARSALPAMVAMLGSNDLGHDLRASLVVAVGALARSENAEAVQALTTELRSSNAAGRHLAWMALGRVLESDAIEAREGVARAEVIEVLVKGLLRPAIRADRPWAALALAIAVRDDPEDSPSRQLAVVKLRETFLAETNPDQAGALAIALGLVRDVEGTLLVMDRLAEADPQLKEFLVQGLGLSGHFRAQAPLLAVTADRGVTPVLRYEAARALGLLHCAETVDVLTELLAGQTAQYPRDSVALALGGYGGELAVAPLMEMVKRPISGDVTRTRAILALAEIGDRGGVAWYTPYSVDCNPQVKLPALSAILP